MTIISSEQGLSLLRAHRFEEARLALEAVWRAGQAQADELVGLALACVHLSDVPAAQHALDKALELQPTHFHALISQADLHALVGRKREAAGAYQRLLRLHGDPKRLNEGEQRELQRAITMVAHYQEQFSMELQQGLERVMAEARIQHGKSSCERFERALALLRGERRIYRSEPRSFLFPELPDVEIFDPGQFEWIPVLEAQTAAIRAELQALLADGELPFQPYVQRVPGRPVLRSGLMNNPNWSACHLWHNGTPVPAMLERCTATMRALQAVPLVHMPDRAPNVMFSLLRPGAHIPPHHGLLNTRCIAHLPLVVPPGCALRVGNAVHDWQEGRVVVFNDSIEHEAWNRSDELRVVLLFEIWRPELSKAERALVTTLFEALNLQSGEG